jgi:hypothetical protein
MLYTTKMATRYEMVEKTMGGGGWVALQKMDFPEFLENRLGEKK